jgi:CheY-like chemotaxis protein
MDEKLKQRILLVEDDVFIYKAYSVGLTRAGYDVTVAKDGEEAMDMLKKEKFQLVLLDLILARLDGFEVLKRIKADDMLKNIPVIVLSNLSQPQDIQRCKQLGAADYFVKADMPLVKIVEETKKHLPLSA